MKGKRKMQSVIKWSGSKKSQAQNITNYIQKSYDTYYEPFCGSCAVLAYILEREHNLANQFKNFVCSDLNQDLINSYNFIKFNPNKVIEDYYRHWNEMNKSSNSTDDKKNYFEMVRKRLNQKHDCSDFIFIMRTTVNGMPRYNKKGNFNNAFHVARDGITPNKFEKIVKEWSNILNKYNVQFVCQSFEKVKPNENDLVYLDPPYTNCFGGFNKNSFFAFLEGLECDWLLSYDGVAKNANSSSELPKTLYKRHFFIDGGNSSFRGVVENNKESLYLNFEPDFWLF